MVRYDSNMIQACLAATERNLNSCGRHAATDGHDINPARLGINSSSYNFHNSAMNLNNALSFAPHSSRLASAGSTEPFFRTHKYFVAHIHFFELNYVFIHFKFVH